jgi:hypothetical protein
MYRKKVAPNTETRVSFSVVCNKKRLPTINLYDSNSASMRSIHYVLKINQLHNYFIFISSLILFCLNTNAQDSLAFNSKKNSIHADAATFLYVGMYAITYERTVIFSKHYKMSLNTGVGGWYFTTITEWYSGYSFPLSMNSLVGSGNHFFEIDLGARYTAMSKSSDKGISDVIPIVDLGYRYQRRNGRGLIFRSFVGLSGIGLGIGKSF